MLPFAALPTLPRIAARALNALLERESWARDRLARHAGKTVRFALGGFALSLTIDSEGRVQEADSAVVPNVTLSAAESSSLARLLPGDGRADFADLTHISGDAALAQVVADLARDLRWDAEDELARVVGDIPAARLLGGARALAGGARERNVSEYLAEESAVLVGRPQWEQWRLDLARFGADSDALARSAAALEARLARLDARRGA
ncbi:ubiquinone biosynthesis accessory factor UbiJ [Bordetella pertussis]|uniref:ubiquinone biosynthesis accessory factor UbiJ n=1 Tax=Bordetella pertussis TaxID=520 RepID=UPI0006802128|nr:SCP2 sterol-binding domain-containing protein [Bordetella pertussis]